MDFQNEVDVSLVGLNAVGKSQLAVFYYIDVVVRAPLDLIIFVIKSKKSKDAIRKLNCPCEIKDKNRNS